MCKGQTTLTASRSRTNYLRPIAVQLRLPDREADRRGSGTIRISASRSNYAAPPLIHIRFHHSCNHSVQRADHHLLLRRFPLVCLFGLRECLLENSGIRVARVRPRLRYHIRNSVRLVFSPAPWLPRRTRQCRNHSFRQPELRAASRASPASCRRSWLPIGRPYLRRDIHERVDPFRSLLHGSCKSCSAP